MPPDVFPSRPVADPVAQRRVASGGGRFARASSPRELDIRITLPARPENVSVVRRVLGAIAETLELPRALCDDMRLAVTEACTNVVRHAYEDPGGMLDVIIRPLGDSLEVVVADSGRGVGPSPDTAGPGFGLPLIAALSDAFEVERAAGQGSRLVMSFQRDRTVSAMGAR